MITISKLKPIATSLVSKEDLQKVVFQYECSATAHLFLSVYRGSAPIVRQIPIAFSGGFGSVDVMLPLQSESFDAAWELSDQSGNVLITTKAPWKRPREWTLYIMVSSHTDIGLHNSQYIQRHNSSLFIDGAAKLCDQTAEEEEHNRYRYTMEGTWFWNNYGMDRGRAAADRIVKDYIRSDKIGACAGIAGNHIQTYGLEELCRSTYERRRLSDDWGIQSETLSMIDNNGLPWSMIGAYADAGYKNIIFAPNQWNPLLSTAWKIDRSAYGYSHNPDANGGGSRIDVRYSSHLPMVFNWQGKDGEQVTVWASTQYHWGGSSFGVFPDTAKRYPKKNMDEILDTIEEKTWGQLELLEQKYPYDIWLFACYVDDQTPDSCLIDQIQHWNAKWKWPKLRTMGNPDEPFDLLRERFQAQIPVLSGDITGGWYQHPLSVSDLMSEKFDADRALPNAEKWATIAGLTDQNYTYPAVEFRRAWDALLFNDEHSYGTSGYQGRRVYETWMQHRDWIEKAKETAQTETTLALQTIASHICANEESVIVFNSTARERLEYIESEDGASYALVEVPAFGYRSVPTRSFKSTDRYAENCSTPPVVENSYYKITFSENGSMCSIYDKELGRELVDPDHIYRANELVYTKDNHKTFITPSIARFEVIYDRNHIYVRSITEEKNLGAEIVQTIVLPHYEKRIDIENELRHVQDMINRNRYYRYLYYAFPFHVENCQRLCHLNGTVAEYAKDVTSHGTDVYMAVNEWCCSENDHFGVALMMKDSHITEFDHIHPDKTDFGAAGEGSQIFSYLANDWLQMHICGGSHLNYHFRYSITSYEGGYESAKIPWMAERFVNPVETVRIPAQNGDLPEGAHSFMELNPDLRFICLKRADDGCGMIARFYGESSDVRLTALNAEPATVDERPASEPVKKGFITYRLGKKTVRIKQRAPIIHPAKNGVPAPIGSVYTGLITKPRAAAGENMGHLYLLWGASMEENFSHYKLYRSEISGFMANEKSFIADVYPEEYRVGRYEDTGLKNHTCYYYRVCAVNQEGVYGPMSEEFFAYTREPLTDLEGDGRE